MTILDSDAGVLPPEKIEYWRLIRQLKSQLETIPLPLSEPNQMAQVESTVTQFLKEIHEHLGSFLLDRDAYYVVFALTAYCDESIQKKAGGEGLEWTPIQKSLFNITNAGNTFYEMIQSFRGRYDVPGIIHETFLFILANGFEGRYAGDPKAIERYVGELRSCIQTVGIMPDLEEPTKLKRRLFRMPLYGYVLAVLTLVFIVNSILQSMADQFSFKAYIH